MIAGSLEKAATDSGWLASLAGPELMPVKPTVCVGASSLSVTELGGSKFGASLIALIVTVKLRVTLLLSPWPSLTVTLIVTGPLTAVFSSGCGVKVNVPVLFGLV